MLPGRDNGKKHVSRDGIDVCQVVTAGPAVESIGGIRLKEDLRVKNIAFFWEMSSRSCPAIQKKSRLAFAFCHISDVPFPF